MVQATGGFSSASLASQFKDSSSFWRACFLALWKPDMAGHGQPPKQRPQAPNPSTEGLLPVPLTERSATFPSSVGCVLGNLHGLGILMGLSSAPDHDVLASLSPARTMTGW